MPHLLVSAVGRESFITKTRPWYLYLKVQSGKEILVYFVESKGKTQKQADICVSWLVKFHKFGIPDGD